MRRASARIAAGIGRGRPADRAVQREARGVLLGLGGPVVHRDRHEHRALRRQRGEVRGAGDRVRDVLGARRLEAPLDERVRHARRVAVRQQRLERHQRARLLARGDHQRALVRPRVEDRAHRVADAGRRVEVDERGTPARPARSRRRSRPPTPPGGRARSGSPPGSPRASAARSSPGCRRTSSSPASAGTRRWPPARWSWAAILVSSVPPDESRRDARVRAAPERRDRRRSRPAARRRRHRGPGHRRLPQRLARLDGPRHDDRAAARARPRARRRGRRGRAARRAALQEGDRVTAPFCCGCGRCEPCRRGETQVCENQYQPGFTAWGSFAELRRDPARRPQPRRAARGAGLRRRGGARLPLHDLVGRPSHVTAGPRPASGWRCTAAAASASRRS